MPTLIPLLTEFEKEHISERQPLPEKYLGLSDADMDSRIASVRKKLGNGDLAKLLGAGDTWNIAG